jgi:hypothetical protein
MGQCAVDEIWHAKRQFAGAASLIAQLDTLHNFRMRRLGNKAGKGQSFCHDALVAGADGVVI